MQIKDRSNNEEQCSILSGIRPVDKASILPPQSLMGVLDDISRNKVINSSTLIGKYEEAQERDSAYEELDKMIKEQYGTQWLTEEE